MIMRSDQVALVPLALHSDCKCLVVSMTTKCRCCCCCLSDTGFTGARLARERRDSAVTIVVRGRTRATKVSLCTAEAAAKLSRLFLAAFFVRRTFARFQGARKLARLQAAAVCLVETLDEA